MADVLEPASSNQPGFQRFTRWLLPSALAVYCFWAILLIIQNPGVQYDEALLVSGAVHMLNSPGELTLKHDPDTWFCVLGRCLPIMTVRYVGAAKEYLCLPLFRIFGAHAVIIRLVAMLLALLGIWGIAKLVRDQVGQLAAGAVAMVLAINPTFVDLTVFDNDAIALMMASLGLLCLAVSAYLRKRTLQSAIWIGAAMAFGIWARANYVFVLAALCGAVFILLRRKLPQVPASHWAGIAAGGLMAGAPFLIYQIRSGGGTWQGLSMFVSHTTYWDRISTRWVQLSEMLLSDREHRAIWAGPDMPVWQVWFSPTLVFAACCTIFAMRGRSEPIRLWARIAALGFLILTVLLFLSRLELSEHHLVTLLPIAAVAATLAGVMLAKNHREGEIVVAILAAIYGASALYWQVSAVRGVARTGGVGVWSDAEYSLAADIRKNYSNQEIQILDWGLQSNLYFLTQGRMRSREVWPNASLERSDSGQPWPEEVRKGGVFLLNGPENRQFPDPSTGFLKAVADSRASVRRHPYMQRNKTVYAEIIEIEPDTSPEPRPSPDTSAFIGNRIDMSDIRFSPQLTGFHRIEENGWRWTRREFSIVLAAPPSANSVRLKLQLYIPDLIIQKLGSIQLRAEVNGHVLGPQAYRDAGNHEFDRDVTGMLMRPGPNRVHFSLDKHLEPSATDDRELGVIVKSASFEPN